MLQQIAPGVLFHQSELLQNNAVVVQGHSGLLLVDPGITNAEMLCLANDLRQLGRPVVAGFSTHPDWDHVLWSPAFGHAPRYGTARCAAVMRDLRSGAGWQAQVLEGLPPEIAAETLLELFGLITPLPVGATHFTWDGPEIQIIEHSAHAPGHAALLIGERRLLIAGDMLSDRFIPILDFNAAGPIADYLTALRLLEAVAGDVDHFIPGHGSPGDARELRARLDQDRAYVHALRDDLPIDDPRIGPSAPAGWEWVSDVHAAQRRQLAAKREQGPMPE